MLAKRPPNETSHERGDSRRTLDQKLVELTDVIHCVQVPIPKYVDKAVLEFFKGNSQAAVGNLQEAIRCGHMDVCSFWEAFHYISRTCMAVDRYISELSLLESEEELQQKTSIAVREFPGGIEGLHLGIRVNLRSNSLRVPAPTESDALSGPCLQLLRCSHPRKAGLLDGVSSAGAGVFPTPPVRTGASHSGV